MGRRFLLKDWMNCTCGDLVKVTPSKRNDHPEFPGEPYLGCSFTNGEGGRPPELLVNITVFRGKHNDTAGHDPSA
jgi:hypothetical protein